MPANSRWDLIQRLKGLNYLNNLNDAVLNVLITNILFGFHDSVYHDTIMKITNKMQL